MATLVLTVIGDDQTGLVDALAGTIAEHRGNWERSHMAQLAGKFAGIVLATVPDANVQALIGALKPLETKGLLDITVEEADESTRVVDDPAATASFGIELVGQDRLGIIHDLAGALAEIGVSIDELTSRTTEAPMAGGLLFEAEATVSGPIGLAITDLEDAVAALGRDVQLAVRPILQS